MNKLKKLICLAMVVLLCAVGFGACQKQNADALNLPPEGVYPMTLTDSMDREVLIEKEPSTIVSVSPSNTEVIFALGKGENLIGVTTMCNYPSEALAVEKMGDYSGPSTEKIIAANPDIVLAENVPADTLAMLENAGITVFATKYEIIDDVYANILTFGRILNSDDTAEEIVSSMRSSIEDTINQVKTQGAKKVFLDLGGFYSVSNDTFIGEIFTALGCENIVGDAQTQWPAVSKEEIIAQNPDVYLSTFTTREELEQTEGFSSLNAFQTGNVVVFTGEDCDVVQRPGPRLAQAFRLYAEAIYPEAFSESAK